MHFLSPFDSPSQPPSATPSWPPPWRPPSCTGGSSTRRDTTRATQRTGFRVKEFPHWFLQLWDISQFPFIKIENIIRFLKKKSDKDIFCPQSKNYPGNFRTRFSSLFPTILLGVFAENCLRKKRKKKKRYFTFDAKTQLFWTFYYWKNGEILFLVGIFFRIVFFG